MSTRFRWAAALAAALLPMTPPSWTPAAAQEPLAPRVTEISPGDNISVMTAALSPDGRWIAYSRLLTETSANLWVMPVGGGAPVRLTGEGHFDDSPVWGPDGTRLYFRSNRPARGADKYFGMVIPVDPATGRAAGAPRQLTAEEIAPPNIQPSPDGRSVAYLTREANTLRIHVIPATGGHARTVAELDGTAFVFNLGWTSDGDLLYSTRPAQGETRIAYRLPAGGGTPVEIFRTDRTIRAMGPGGDLFVVTSPGSGPREAMIEVVRADGRVLARHTGDRNMRPSALSRDGRTLIGVTTRVTSAIRVVPLAGGRPVDVTAGDHYDWHAAWTPDGSEVLVVGTVDDRGTIVAAPRTGGATRPLPATLPADEKDATWLVADTEHALYQVPVPGTERRRLVAISLRDGSRQVMSENFRRVYVVGAGGAYDYADGQFLFVEQAGDQAELRIGRPGAASQLLRSFPAELAGRRSLAVHGQRVAWFEQAGDSAHLFLSTGPTAEAVRLLSTPVATQCCRVNLTFSNDGRRLLTQDLGDRAGEGRMVLLELSPDGRAIQNQRTLDSGAHYWYEAQWLPDDRAVAILAGYEGLRTHVLLVPLREGEAPVTITREDPAPKWGFALSPDGRYVAYPGEIWHGGSFWTMDLSPVTLSARSRR